MKLLFFDDFKLGVLKDESVVDISDVVKDIPHTEPGNLISGLIAQFSDYQGRYPLDAALCIRGFETRGNSGNSGVTSVPLRRADETSRSRWYAC